MRIVSVLFAFLVSFASAQQLSVSTGTPYHPIFSVVYEHPTAGGSVSIGGGYVLKTGFATAGFTEHISASAIGNLTVDGNATIRFDGLFDASLGARGTIGPVAASLTVRGFHGHPDTKSISAHEMSGWGFAAIATYRSGNTVMTIAPEWLFTDAGQQADIHGSVRLIRLLGRNELRFDVDLHSGTNWETFEAEAGATFALNRGRKPAWEFGAVFTANQLGVTPGVRFMIVEQFASRLTVRATGSIMPRNFHHPAVQFDTSLTAPLTRADLHVHVGATYDDTVRFVAQLKVDIPLTGE